MTPVVDIMLPSYRKWEPETAMSLAQLLCNSPGLVRQVIHPKWMYIDQARNDCVRETLKGPATHLLGLDDDMVWSPDLLHRLLAHNRPVVGALYFMRKAPHEIAAGNFDRDVCKPLDSLPGGIQQVEYLGLGAALIETRLFREMQGRFKDESWFQSRECGEDVWFFRRLKKMGISVFLDGALRCGHMTEMCVTEGHWNHYHSEKS